MNQLLSALVLPLVARHQQLVSRIKASQLFVTACVALVVALAPMSVRADFVTVISPTVTGDEDTIIPLGVTADPALSNGGAEMDYIGSYTAFVDAADASKQVVVPLPQGTQYVRITGVGGNDNAADSSRDEEFLTLHAFVDLSSATYGGSIVANSDDVADSVYAFADVSSGNASDSAITSGRITSATNVTIAVTSDGTALTLEGNQTLWDQAYFFEFLSAESTSASFLGSSSELLAQGAAPAVLTLPTSANFARVFFAQSVAQRVTDEDKGIANIMIDLDTGFASGVINLDGGRGNLQSAYAFTGYDLSSGLPVLDPASGVTLVGDYVADSSHLPNPTLQLTDNVLTITRATDFGDRANSLVSVASYERLTVPSVAAHLGSTSAFADFPRLTHLENENNSLVLTLPIPVNAKTATLNFAQLFFGDTRINENTGFGQLTVDLVGQTVSGSLATVRISDPDLVGLNNLPFGSTVDSEIGSTVTANRSSINEFVDQYIGVLQFDVIDTAPNQSLQISATVPDFSEGLDHLWHADWFGPQPVLFEGAGNGTFSAGGIDFVSGPQYINPADIASLTYTPNPDLAEGPINASFTHGVDVDPLQIFVRRVADEPTLVVADQTLPQNVATNIASAIDAQLIDIDGSETLGVFVTLQPGHILSDGGANTFTAAAGSDTADIAGWDLANLTYEFTTPGVFPVTVRAESTDSDNFTDNVADSTDLVADVTDTFDVTILVDSDGDGTADVNDSDSDNDGIPDSTEGTGDADEDGIPDNLDPDSDNDGIPDAIEGNGDSDGNGLPDYLDTDSDSDGIDDSVEAQLSGNDDDGDGIDNVFDVDFTNGTDADNDGVDDTLEASGGADTDGDGVPDYLDSDGGLNPLLTNSATPTLSGEIFVAPGEILSVTVNGVTYTDGDGNLVLNSDGTWQLTIPASDALTDGDFDVAVMVTDEAGNTTTDVGTDELTVDTTPPVAPGVTSLTTNDDTPVIKGTSFMADGESLSVEVNGVTYTEGDGNLVVNPDGTWELTIPGSDALIDGLYDVTATVTDAVGNTRSDAGSSELLIDTNAPNAPGVTSLTTNDTTPLISGTADLAPDESLSVEVDGVLYTEGDGKLIVNPDSTWTLAIPTSLADGQYDVTATATDAAGNTSTDPSAGELHIDATAPAAPTVEPLISAEATPILTGVVKLAPGEILTVEVNGVRYTQGDGNLVVNLDGTWELVIPASDALNEGNFPVTVRVIDAAGNSSQTISPNALVILPADDFDGDGIPDIVDLDDDNDGIPDSVEGEGERDTDADGQPDSRDLDSDNDGLFDIVEVGGDDTDNDGQVDNFLDNDDNGLSDELQIVPFDIVDTDGDRIPDFRDLDSDNDGLTDLFENGSKRRQQRRTHRWLYRCQRRWR